jgi:MoxR-like ATPase
VPSPICLIDTRGRVLNTGPVDASAFADPTAVVTALKQVRYLPDDGLAAAVFLAYSQGRALFLEGEPGVGKTVLAERLAESLGAKFIRLQCYSGMDRSQALYEWDFPRQILALRSAETEGKVLSVGSMYSTDYLVPRPVLQAVFHDGRTVLLIDEIDRADDEFEALLLEVLDRRTVSIPELNEIAPARDLMIVLTSNRTREVHDALKRRCIYYWIDHPEVGREIDILRLHRPEASPALLYGVAEAMYRLRRSEKLSRSPGLSESLDYVDAATALGAKRLTEEVVKLALGTIVKHHDDQDVARQVLHAVLLEADTRQGIGDAEQ